MSVPRIPAAVTLTAGSRTPIYTGTVTAAVSFSIKAGIATIVFAAALPTKGYSPGPTPGSTAGADQVTLWGFSTATYFNGLQVSVLDNPGPVSFRFYISHADVNSTADAGSTAIAPPQGGYRSARIEVDAGAAAANVYVGDLNVSSTRYAENLKLVGQIAVTIASGTIPVERIFCDTDTTSTKIQVSLMY